MHEYLREMNEKVLSKYDTITVGEMPYIDDTEEILRVVGEERKELNMIFIFDLVDIDRDSSGFRWGTTTWTVSDMRIIVAIWQTAMKKGGGWNSIFIENHDNPRSVSRYCDDSTEERRQLGAKLLALMQTTLSGTLYIYQGEELGMKNFPLSWPPEEYKDIETQNYWAKMNKLYPHNKEKLQEAREIMQRKARDHSRTPVQWDAGTNAGFCAEGVKPWMRVNDDYKTVNAEAQTKSCESGELSVYQFWQQYLERRKKHKDVFVYGTFTSFESGSADNVIAYQMSSSKEAFLVALNFSGDEVAWTIPEIVKVDGWVDTNYDSWDSKKSTKGSLVLRAWEGVVGKVVL
jgi:glycosidase